MNATLGNAIVGALARLLRPLGLGPLAGADPELPDPDEPDTLEAVLAWLNEGLSQALVVDGPEGIAKAAWVPIDRVLLARDRLALIIDDRKSRLDIPGRDAYRSVS